MSIHEVSSAETRPLRLMLIDDDPVFRLGLRFWLNQFSDLTVVAEAESGAVGLAILANQRGGGNEMVAAAIAPLMLDLIILDLSLGCVDPTQIQGLTLCQHIKTLCPDLPVLLLSTRLEPLLLASAQQAGAMGFCPKAMDVAELGTAIRQVASGQPYWYQLGSSPRLRSASEAGNLASPAAPPRPLAIARRNLRRYGLQQIDATLAVLTHQLQADLSLLDRVAIAGRHRELRAARWLVQRLLATPGVSDTEPQRQPVVESAIATPSPSPHSPPPPQIDQIINVRRVQSVLFDTVLTHLQGELLNQTDRPLEIDGLREDKKRELFYLILRKVEALLDELRYSQVQLEQLAEKRSTILLDLWQATTTDFFGKYYTVTLGNQAVEVVDTVLQDGAIVQTAILDKIPFVPDLLTHLLFQTPLLVNSTPYPPGNPEALAQAEAILEHLLIQVANSVIQPLLNRFADVEEIKRQFYDRRCMASRDMERFRNNLSWTYRIEKYVGEPKDIFESQYRLLVFQGRGIKRIALYTPRGQELEQLAGVQFAVTLALETRDAIAPRLRSAISVIGSGLVYVLTEVVGRGIGLVGRGILKGIGNAWQDSRYRRNERPR